MTIPEVMKDYSTTTASVKWFHGECGTVGP